MNYAHIIPRAMAAGFVGTLLVTIAVYAFAAVGYPQSGLTELFGGILFENEPERFSWSWWVMMAWHFNFGAVLFPHIYAMFLSRELPGAPWQKGLLMGLGLATLVELLFKPLFGMGLFSGQLPNPAIAVFASYLVHAIYGVTLGAITGEVQHPSEKAVDERAAHHHRGMHLRPH
ncbi:MAG TPA: DUF6789 family protein [Candidatus Limnocylindrales bacterium]|nr:DUF6789 family protein [Candidatus Limnocylindrales bacterium]